MDRGRASITRGLVLACTVTAMVGLSTPARAACPERIAVASGATLSGIARACGVSLEALRQVNPGIRPDTLQAGTTLAVPRPAFPSVQLPIGRQGIGIARPLVPPTVGGTGSTVILPPAAPSMPRQHILRGFGDQPGQLPLPPGHGSPFPAPFSLR